MVLYGFLDICQLKCVILSCFFCFVQMWCLYAFDAVIPWFFIQC